MGLRRRGTGITLPATLLLKQPKDTVKQHWSSGSYLPGADKLKINFLSDKVAKNLNFRSYWGLEDETTGSIGNKRSWKCLLEKLVGASKEPDVSCSSETEGDRGPGPPER